MDLEEILIKQLKKEALRYHTPGKFNEDLRRKISLMEAYPPNHHPLLEENLRSAKIDLLRFYLRTNQAII